MFRFCAGSGADAEGREARKVNKQIDEQLAKDKQVSALESPDPICLFIDLFDCKLIFLSLPCFYHQPSSFFHSILAHKIQNGPFECLDTEIIISTRKRLLNSHKHVSFLDASLSRIYFLKI